uniref:MARVEL domain-containing protein n=1 Tax=Trichuris muris TaxID=70415 RepID=A0A5S6QKZ4_TRIMR
MPRNRKEFDGFDPMLLIDIVLKVLMFVIACVTLGLSAEYSDDYTVAIIIASGSLTLLYALVGLLLELGIVSKCPEAHGNCYIADALCASFCLCFWLLSAGNGITISLRSGAKTTELFGWIAACCSLEVILFISAAGLSCFQWLSLRFRS